MVRTRDWINRLLGILTALTLLATVCMLAWVESRYRREMAANIERTRENFQRSGLLGDPTDLTPRFQDLEALARQAENASTMIRRILVTKRTRTADGERWIVLRPYYFTSLYPDWEKRLAALQPASLVVNGEEVGRLYFELDMRPIRGVRATILAAAGLLALLLALLILRIFRQEQALNATHAVLRQNQREMIRMERLALAGTLSANIFHDIRKPVTNIKHELEDLTDALGGFAGATRALKNMRDQVDLYFDILRDLNFERFVRADQTDEEFVDVNRVLEQSLQLVQYERGATRVHRELQQELPLVLAHPYRLIQVFSNIILNAYQVLEGQGELTVHSTQDEADRRDNQPWVQVTIRDSGPGVQPEHLPFLFTPFFSTKEESRGTGLGLYISKMIIEQMGGEISVESVFGEGAVFHIRLPARD